MACDKIFFADIDTRMLTLGAMVITLAFWAGVVELQPMIDGLSVQELPVSSVASALQQPPIVPVPNPSSKTDKIPKGHPAGGAGVNCPVMGSYGLSGGKLQECEYMLPFHPQYLLPQKTLLIDKTHISCTIWTNTSKMGRVPHQFRSLVTIQLFRSIPGC